MNFWITLAIAGATFIGIALGYIPRLRANRTTIALMGAGLLIATRQVAFGDIGKFLDLDTLILLFSMMIINANLYLAGFFDWAGKRLLRITRSPRTFLALEILLTGVLSAIFLNDTICIMFTPLVLGITLNAKRNPLPYLIALATAANVGSVATLTGNPQNMIIGIAGSIPYLRFLTVLAPIALLSLGLVWVVIVLLYPREFAVDQSFEVQPTEPAIYKPLLIKSLIVMVGLMAAFLAGFPIAEASFIAACILLFTRRVKPEKIFAEIDWGILAFFAALFIVTGSLEVSGITAHLFTWVSTLGTMNVLGLSSLTVLLSNLVSNVPAVLLLKPLVLGLPNAEAGWLTLAAASTLAGNLTLLGSVANLIVAEISERWRVTITFWEYTKAGLMITLLSMVIAVSYLGLVIW